MKRTEFERVSPESVGISSRHIRELVDELEASGTEMHGLMVMRHGKVAAEGWWAPYAPGIRHGLQSLTKTYAATAVGIAYTQGLLKLSDRVIDIFPQEAPVNPSENLQKLTVRDVLCMGCGMDEMPRPSKDWIRDFLATPVNHVPGTAFMYNSTGSSILGAIVCRLAKTSLQAYLKENLFDKIGIDAENIRWMYMPDGIEIGGGGMLATTEDNLRLMKLYADGGVWQGERILVEDYVALATTSQNDSASEEKNNPPAKDNFLGYGFQIWMCKPENTYRADGAMGQFSIVCPGKDLIVSINETAPGAHWAQSTLDIVWNFIAKLGNESSLPEDEAQAKSLKAYLGGRALQSPVYAPFGPEKALLNGKKYTITSGEVGIAPRMMAMMSGAGPAPGTDDMQFSFDVSGCDLQYSAGGKSITLRIATDGSRSLNRLGDASEATTLVYMSGAFIDGAFEVRLRWVETCFEKIMRVKPVGDSQVEIVTKSSFSIFPGHSDEQVATGTCGA